VGSIYKRRRHKAAHEGVACDSICVVKKAGILHNTENIARALAHTRASERHTHTHIGIRAGLRRENRNRRAIDAKNGVLHDTTRALSCAGYTCKFQGWILPSMNYVSTMHTQLASLVLYGAISSGREPSINLSRERARARALAAPIKNVCRVLL